MKPKLVIFLIAFAMLAGGCSEESQVEGLIATKPEVVAVNAEILKGEQKTISITIKGTACNLLVYNYFTVSGSTEYRTCVMTIKNGAGTFSCLWSDPSYYIKKAATGTTITASMFSPESADAMLFSTTNPVNTSNYTWYQSTVRFNEVCYVPVKFKTGDGKTIYAYLVLTPAADKLVISKAVYNEVGEVSVGKE